MAGIKVVCRVVLEVTIGEYPIATSFREMAEDATAKAANVIDNALARFGRPPNVRMVGLPQPLAMSADWALVDSIALHDAGKTKNEEP